MTTTPLLLDKVQRQAYLCLSICASGQVNFNAQKFGPFVKLGGSLSIIFLVAGQMAEPASDESLLKVAMHLGADAKVLVESIQEAKNLRTNIVTMVSLCHDVHTCRVSSGPRFLCLQ